MADLSFSYIIKFIYSILTIILLVFVYTYLTSLEAKGCACAMTPNTAFIKGFTLFAIIYLIFTGLISDAMIEETFGPGIAVLHNVIYFVFTIVFIYYLYLVFQYTRYLVNEKCKCSVDIRREIIMIGSLIEFALIFILFLLHIIVFVIFNSLFTIVKGFSDDSGKITDVIRDPVGSITKVPKTINQELSNISSYVKKTGKELSKIASKRRSNSKASK